MLPYPDGEKVRHSFWAGWVPQRHIKICSRRWTPQKGYLCSIQGWPVINSNNIYHLGMFTAENRKPRPLLVKFIWVADDARVLSKRIIACCSCYHQARHVPLYLVLSSLVMFCCWKQFRPQCPANCFCSPAFYWQPVPISSSYLCCDLASHIEWHWLSHQPPAVKTIPLHPRLILILMLLSHLPPQSLIND